MSESFQDDPVLVPVEQQVQYFRVYSTDGTLLGAFWMGDKDKRCGFIPIGKDGREAASAWNERAAIAMRTVGHCRDAFAYWSNPTGIGWGAGPIERASSQEAVRAQLEATVA